MIQKIIHYCWFGGNPLPELAQRCIASWRKFLPDFEIWQWTDGITEGRNYGDSKLYETEQGSYETLRYENENSLPLGVNTNHNGLFDRVMTFDVNSIPYTKEAYRQKKYAFVSDYARFWILYKYGGIYFDTDVEVIRPMNDIIAKGNFMGFEMDPDGENTPGRYAPRYCFDVALGLGFGITKEHPFMQKMLSIYENMKFEGASLNPWMKTIVAYTTEALMEEGLKNVQGIQNVGDITIYPHEYFAPINVISGRLHITQNTYTIHWYMGSWDDKKKSLKDVVRNLLPEWLYFLNNKIKRRKFRIK